MIIYSYLYEYNLFDVLVEFLLFDKPLDINNEKIIINALLKYNKEGDSIKIYVIGPPGSGKTTLAKKLSEHYAMNYYELDLLVFDDENGHVRRSDEEILKKFNEIIDKENWIIEDVGRTKFKKGIELSDTIYYLKFSKIQIMKRIVKRWLRQRIGSEQYNYPPTFAQLFDFFKVANSYFKKEKNKLCILEEYKDKVVYIDAKKIHSFFET